MARPEQRTYRADQRGMRERASRHALDPCSALHSARLHAARKVSVSASSISIALAAPGMPAT